jgi:hypothetical protein
LNKSKNILDINNSKLIIEISNNQSYDDIYVEKLLQKYFKSYNSTLENNNSNELYQNKIIDEITLFLSKTVINYKELNEDEINNLKKIEKIKNVRQIFIKFLHIWRKNRLNKSEKNDKQYIITLFNNNVKGVEICLKGKNKNHCGAEGHWLETKMGIKHNAKNEPDINGYEMKKQSSKTTIGDFSASEYAFSGKNKRNNINNHNNWTDDIKIDRTNFIKYFGNPNVNKNNRYSWSGSCVPTYNNWNSNGQNLLILENNDIVIYYSFKYDTRTVKY